VTPQFKSNLIAAILWNGLYITLVVTGCLVWFGVIKNQI
jgi:hypothetical protein